MPSVTVGLGATSYDIEIEHGLLEQAGKRLAPFARNNRLVIVTDSNVSEAVLPRFSAALANAGIIADPIILPAGESTKSWHHLAGLCDALMAREIDRSDHIIALGGGMIGDLTGFAAAILKRGCNFIQIPTTLLAQVDSSVGGKTAINTAAGKNLVGAFHQPRLVLIDPKVLDTLPMRERRAGYAEIVKYGLLGDTAFFDWCEANGHQVLEGEPDALSYAIETSVCSKADIVVADERETQDVRALLNLGHTFGHALEAETGFSDRLLHGEAVAAGMALAFAFSARQHICPAADVERVAAHLRAVGLPDGLTAAGVTATGATLVGHMLHDKKKSGNTLPFILARGIGQAYVDKSVSLEDVAVFLDEAR
jgi:3-dehydroquinate synthase